MNPQITTSRFSPDRVLRWVVVALLAAGTGFLVWTFVRLLVYLLVGALLAYVMRPLKDRIQGLGLGPIPAILLTFLVAATLIAFFLRTMVPFAAQQISAVSSELSPERVAATVAERLGSWIPVDPARIRTGLVQSMNTLLQEDRITQMAGSVIDLFTNLFYAVVVVPFVAFFFLKDGTRLRTGLLAMVPNRYFEVTLGIVEKVESTVGRYFRAIAVQSLSIATLSSVLLAIAGLDFAVAVGLFAGLANMIPYFGPLLGFAAGVLIGISQTGDFSLFVGVMVAMALTQLADNVFFQPFIFSRAARAHPLVILFTVLIAAQLAGIIGMLVAIPVMTTLRVVITEVSWSMSNYKGLRTI